MTAKQAAEAYGLKVGRNGKACCPFHNDKKPSMLIDDRYYCFGCGATGDAVDLTKQLLGLDSKAAAQRLASDFGIAVLELSSNLEKRKFARKSHSSGKEENANIWIGRSLKILFLYRDLLDLWKQLYKPSITDQDWHPRFCEAQLEYAKLENFIDELLSCSKTEADEMKNCCGKEVKKIEKRLERYLREDT